MAELRRISVSDNFNLDEFLDPYTYLFEKDNGIDKMDFKVFQIAQKIREIHGKPIIINNWWATYQRLKKEGYSEINIVKIIEADNNVRKWSGLRTDRSNVGAKNGAHYKGQAADLVGNGDEYYNLVKNHAKELYCLGLRRIEDKRITRTWLHIDTLERNTKPNSIRVVDLTKSTETICFN